MRENNRREFLVSVAGFGAGVSGYLAHPHHEADAFSALFRVEAATIEESRRVLGLGSIQVSELACVSKDLGVIKFA